MNSRTSRLCLFPWLLRIVAYVFLALCPVSVSYGYDSIGNITSLVRIGIQDSGTPIYHAYLTDHQGNVRVVVDENATVKQVNHYYPYGALFAESTNGDVQPYKYNGKELDRMHGKAATYAEAVSDIKENTTTLVDGNASTTDRIKAVFSLASEFLPVSFGDVKDVVKIVKNVHGNSKLSTKAQYAYDIIDKRTDKVVKTGISGGKIRKDGKSYRAEQQVRKWNKEEGRYIYESEITHQEPAGAGARDKILKYEKDRATKLREELDHDKHQKP